MGLEVMHFRFASQKKKIQHQTHRLQEENRSGKNVYPHEMKPENWSWSDTQASETGAQYDHEIRLNSSPVLRTSFQQAAISPVRHTHLTKPHRLVAKTGEAGRSSSTGGAVLTSGVGGSSTGLDSDSGLEGGGGVDALILLVVILVVLVVVLVNAGD